MHADAGALDVLPWWAWALMAAAAVAAAVGVRLAWMRGSPQRRGVAPAAPGTPEAPFRAVKIAPIRNIDGLMSPPLGTARLEYARPAAAGGTPGLQAVTVA